MSKELEALERIIETFYNKESDDIKLVKTALKDYEMEHTLRIRLENINYELIREKQENDKKLKALEIIKKKDVDVGWLKRAKDLNEYNNGMGINSYSALTKEEYDLLKGWLK